LIPCSSNGSMNLDMSPVERGSDGSSPAASTVPGGERGGAPGGPRGAARARRCQGGAAMSKLQQIRQKCLSCVDGEGEIRRCAFFACPLWPFRMSANPFLQGTSGSFQPRQPDKARQIWGSTNVPLETLRSWAGRNLMPETVDSPDPRELTVEELEALGCRNRSPARALRLEARANDMTYAQRQAAWLQDPLPPAPQLEALTHRWPDGSPLGCRESRTSGAGTYHGGLRSASARRFFEAEGTHPRPGASGGIRPRSRLIPL
jgi:hypothetical protein